jgi:DNA-directed RNA polymerase subunit M/transcription elongation factor TFIIS
MSDIINSHEIFVTAFPHCIPLPLYIYQHQTYLDQPYRLNKILLFLGCARNNKNFRTNITISEQNIIAATIERSCYNQTVKKVEENNVPCHWNSPDFVTIYNIFCTEKANNLNPDSLVESAYLTECILDGTIDPKNIGCMSSFQMAPKDQDREMLRQMTERLEKEPDIEKFTTLYVCPNNGCKDPLTGYRTKKAKIKMKTTRSLDEGKSMFLKCVECSREWKQG